MLMASTPRDISDIVAMYPGLSSNFVARLDAVVTDDFTTYPGESSAQSRVS